MQTTRPTWTIDDWTKDDWDAYRDEIPEPAPLYRADALDGGNGLGLREYEAEPITQPLHTPGAWFRPHAS